MKPRYYLKDFAKKKPKKLKAITIPKEIETEYYKELRFMITQIRERFINAIEGLDKENIKEQFQDASYTSIMNKIVTQTVEKLNTQFGSKRLSRLVQRMIEKTDKSQKWKWKRMAELGFGFDISSAPEFKGYKPFMRAMIKKNLALVKNLKQEALYRAEMALRTAVEKGKSIPQVRAEIMSSGKVGYKKATTIARNEIKNVTVQLNMERYKNAGFTMYEWSTARDERVRGRPSGRYPKAKPNHWMMEGLICRFDDPTVYSADKGKTWRKRMASMPKEHAGEPINCRCEQIII